MKTRIEIKNLFLGATLGAIVMFSLGAALTREPAPVEYKTLREVVTGAFDGKLNNMAEQGWTLVSSSTTQSAPTADMHAVVIFKREKMR